MASNPDRGEILLTELQVRAAALRECRLGKRGGLGGDSGDGGRGLGDAAHRAPDPLSAETRVVSVRSGCPTPGTGLPRALGGHRAEGPSVPAGGAVCSHGSPPGVTAPPSPLNPAP